MFTIETQPFGWVVQRTREDIKFLTTKLREEFPVKDIVEIDQGTLNKPILEAFLAKLAQTSAVNKSYTLIEFLSNNSPDFREKA